MKVSSSLKKHLAAGFLSSQAIRALCMFCMNSCWFTAYWCYTGSLPGKRHNDIATYSWQTSQGEPEQLLCFSSSWVGVLSCKAFLTCKTPKKTWQCLPGYSQDMTTSQWKHRHQNDETINRGHQIIGKQEQINYQKAEDKMRKVHH